MVEKIPEAAFREAIANALIHRVWDINSHIRVSMFDDRIEILLFILLRTAYWAAFNLPDVEFIVIGRSLTRIPVRYKLIDS